MQARRRKLDIDVETRTCDRLAFSAPARTSLLFPISESCRINVSQAPEVEVTNRWIRMIEVKIS